MVNNPPSSAEVVHTQSPERLWGISPESVYLALCGINSGEGIASALAPHHRGEVLASNDERDQEAVVAVHRYLLGELGFVDDSENLTDSARLTLTTDQPTSAVQTVAVHRLPRLRSFLREFDNLDTVRVPRSELQTLVQGEYDEGFIVPLLCSLGFIELYPQGAVVYDEIIEQTLETTSRDWSASDSAISLSAAIVDVETPQIIARLASEITNDTVSVAAVKEASDIDAIASLGTQPPRRTPNTKFREVLETVNGALTEEIRLLQTVLKPGQEEVTVTQTEIDATAVEEAFIQNPDSSTIQTVLDLFTTLETHPSVSAVSVPYLSEQTGLDRYPLYRFLSSIPGVKCRMRKDLVLEFETIPQATAGDDRYEDICDRTFKAMHTRMSWRDEVANASVSTSPTSREEIIGSLLTELDDDVVAPTYFVYTLPDPVALGEEQMERYVDENPALQREQARLKRWKNQRSDDVRRFTEMTDRLFSLGQERDLDEQVLRIMTPYDDDTFSEYTSQLRSLLREGYEIRLLTRHTKSRWEWERLRDNLLGELDENRENITIRTYSRYKEYQRIASDTDERDLSEFGIHAKLQTIGHPEEGAALLGSANFMENSYNWNPESGVYTENANFVDAVIDFFDHVWVLAENDEIDLSQLQEIPKRSFYPSYYT